MRFCGSRSRSERLRRPCRDVGRAIPLDGVHRWFSRVRRPHLKAPPARLHHAATDVDREDNPAPGTRVSEVQDA